MVNMIYLSTLLMSLFLTISLIPIFKSMAGALHVVDVPNDRKIHSQPVPKIGGLAMAFGILFPPMVWHLSDGVVMSIIVGSSVIVVFGFLDDARDLGYGAKFFGQILAASLVVGKGGVNIVAVGDLLPSVAALTSYASIPLTLVVIVGVTNAINLSDGLDGLAGGIVILSFLCMSWLAFILGMTAVSVLCLAVIGAVFGFLRFNTHPASIFMGDTGSQLLGFLAITLSIHVSQGSGTISPLFPLILLGFPILDTLSVMMGRILHGKSPFKADKTHFHHRLMELGLNHSEAVFVVYVLQALLISSAFVFRFHSEWFLLGLYLAFSSGILGFFHYARKTGWTATHGEYYEVKLKGTFRRIRDHQLPIRISFPCLTYGFAALLIVSCMAFRSIPDYSLPVLAALLCSMGVISIVKNDWSHMVFRLCFYATVPFVLYAIESDAAIWMGGVSRVAYNGAFGLITLFMVMTLKFTRRKKGFRTTPLDFIILFISLGLPVLVGLEIDGLNLMTLSVHIIVMLFAYEVVMGELRGKNRFINRATVTMFILLFARSAGIHF